MSNIISIIYKARLFLLLYQCTLGLEWKPKIFKARDNCYKHNINSGSGFEISKLKKKEVKCQKLYLSLIFI